MRVVAYFAWFLVLIPLVVAVGCGEPSNALVPVRGTVTFHHEPLRGGTIVFAPDPDRGGRGPIACAEIQPDGTYHLTTGQKHGAVAGWHRVTIVSSDASSAELPRKYCDPESSGIAREVKASVGNVLDIELD